MVESRPIVNNEGTTFDDRLNIGIEFYAFTAYFNDYSMVSRFYHRYTQPHFSRIYND